jgi:hypothetical protein
MPITAGRCPTCSPLPIAPRRLGPTTSRDQILRLSRDDLIAEIGRGEIDLLTQIALVSIIWQKRSCMPLPGL